MSARILVVDDDVALTEMLERLLATAGYRCTATHLAEEGFRLAVAGPVDLVLLDIMVPEMGGWELCRQLRQCSNVPIIFLTALGDAESMVRGLEIGADDYIVKPFEPTVVLARIKAQLRRAGSAAGSNTTTSQLTFGGGELTVDLAARTVTHRKRPVELTPREFDLLAALAGNAGRALSTRELLKRAWSVDDRAAVVNIKPYIHYLRKKLEDDPSAPRWIQTVRGIGYRFVDPQLVY